MTEAEYQSIRANHVITNAVVNLTDDCNLCCPYCFTTKNPRTIDIETMKRAIQFLIAECGRDPTKKATPHIAFFGGEPMLQFDRIIVPIIEWVESNGIKEQHRITFSMTTNGTLLDEEKLIWLKNHNISILLSIDGARQTQDSQRPGRNNKSSFDLLLPQLPIILKYFPDVTFRSTIEPYNVHHIYENYLFARKTGFLNYYITPNVFSEWSAEQLTIAAEQLSFIADTIYQDISSGGKPTLWQDLIRSLKSCFSPEKAEASPIYRCGIGITTVGIAVNGDLNGCQEHNTYLEHDLFYIGNIFDGLNSERHRHLLEAYQAMKHPICKENPSLCDACIYYEECAQHFCPSHNYSLRNGLSENSLTTCIWNRTVKGLAYIMLERTIAEHNEHVVHFLECKQP